jgi:hypothetical protein
MNKLITYLFMAGLFTTINVFADTSSAVTAFKESKEVKTAIEETIKELKRLHGEETKIETSEPTAVLLRVSSGFAGVSSISLVTCAITPKTLNAQTTIIAARVNRVGAPDNNVVKLLGPVQLNDLLEVTRR